MLELNERYSDVSIKVLVIKSAKGDEPDNDTIWQGCSGNKLLDTFNTERFTIMKSKFIKLRAPNMSIYGAGSTDQVTGSGFTVGDPNFPLQSRAILTGWKRWLEFNATNTVQRLPTKWIRNLGRTGSVVSHTMERAVTWNVGPHGYQRGKGEIHRIFEQGPPIICLQDVRIPKRRKNAVKREL